MQHSIQNYRDATKGSCFPLCLFVLHYSSLGQVWGVKWHETGCKKDQIREEETREMRGTAAHVAQDILHSIAARHCTCRLNIEFRSRLLVYGLQECQ